MGFWFSVLVSIFLPMVIIYIGVSLVLVNALSMAMSIVEDKVHGSAVMNFINIGIATLIVLVFGVVFNANYGVTTCFTHSVRSDAAYILCLDSNSATIVTATLRKANCIYKDAISTQ